MKHYIEQEDQDIAYDKASNLPDALDVAHQKEIRRKLEERIELRRLREELEDYEGELEDDFDWPDEDKG